MTMEDTWLARLTGRSGNALEVNSSAYTGHRGARGPDFA